MHSHKDVYLSSYIKAVTLVWGEVGEWGGGGVEIIEVLIHWGFSTGNVMNHVRY